MISDVPVIPMTEAVDWYQYNTGTLRAGPRRATRTPSRPPTTTPDWGSRAAAPEAEGVGGLRNSPGHEARDDEVRRSARLGFFVLTLWAALTLNFFIPRLMPGNPAIAMMARSTGHINPQALHALEIAVRGQHPPEPRRRSTSSYLRNIVTGQLRDVSLTFFPAPVSTRSAGAAVDARPGRDRDGAGVRPRHADRHRRRLAARRQARQRPAAGVRRSPRRCRTSGSRCWPSGCSRSSSAGCPTTAATTSAWHGPSWTVVLRRQTCSGTPAPAGAHDPRSPPIGGWILTMRNNMITDAGRGLRADGAGPRAFQPADHVRLRGAQRDPAQPVRLRHVARLRGRRRDPGRVRVQLPRLGYMLCRRCKNQDYPLMQALFLLITVAVLVCGPGLRLRDRAARPADARPETRSSVGATDQLATPPVGPAPIAGAIARGRGAALLRAVSRNRKAMVGVVLLLVFVVLAVFPQLFASVTTRTRTIFDRRPWAVRRHHCSARPPRAGHLRPAGLGTRQSLVIALVAGALRDRARRPRRRLGRLPRRARRRRPLADHRRLPGHPDLPADHRDRRVRRQGHAARSARHRAGRHRLVLRRPPAAAQALSLRNRDFLESARVRGERRSYIIVFEMLPTMTSLIVANFLGAALYAVLTAAGLQFLGLGDPNSMSWGTMLYWAQNQQALQTGQPLWASRPGSASRCSAPPSPCSTTRSTRSATRRCAVRRPERSAPVVASVPSSLRRAGRLREVCGSDLRRLRTDDGPVARSTASTSTSRAGEFVGVVGESGCGKSTLLFAIAQLLSPPAEITGGSVVFQRPRPGHA